MLVKISMYYINIYTMYNNIFLKTTRLVIVVVDLKKGLLGGLASNTIGDSSAEKYTNNHLGATV